MLIGGFGPLKILVKKYICQRKTGWENDNTLACVSQLVGHHNTTHHFFPAQGTCPGLGLDSP